MSTKKENKLIWDVSDLNPVTEFPKDCRRFNGGFVCPKVRSSPQKPKNGTEASSTRPIPLVIDRIRY